MSLSGQSPSDGHCFIFMSRSFSLVGDRWPNKERNVDDTDSDILAFVLGDRRDKGRFPIDQSVESES